MTFGNSQLRSFTLKLASLLHFSAIIFNLSYIANFKIFLKGIYRCKTFVQRHWNNR